MKGESRQERFGNQVHHPLGADLSAGGRYGANAPGYADRVQVSGEGQEQNGRSSGNVPDIYYAADEGIYVLPEGRDDLREFRNGPSGGPRLIRADEWLLEPQVLKLCDTWLTEEGRDGERAWQRLRLRLSSAAHRLLDSPGGAWTAVTLLHMPELSRRPARLAALRDAQLEALFTSLASLQREGQDGRLDLLAPYPAGPDEFAGIREFTERVAEELLGHAFAAACRVGALIAPDCPPAAAGEIARTADFLVVDGAAAVSAPAESAAHFVRAAEELAAAVRRVKPSAAVFAAGPPAAANMADLYAIGLRGIFCRPEQRTAVLLQAAGLIRRARQAPAERRE